MAEVNVSDTSGGWEVLVAAGQVIRYEFVSNAGQRVEGTFVVPQSAEAIVVNQTMMMKAQHGVAFGNSSGWIFIRAKLMVPVVMGIDEC